jgi:predicted AAA+ superfamily ATPase
MSEFKLRTESIKDNDIISLAVKNENDKKIIKSLTSSEPCLLEGSRGTGKSFLMKISQIELEKKTSTLSIFISFSIGTLKVIFGPDTVYE